MQSFPDIVSMQSFGCHSNSVNYMNSSFNQNICLNNENQNNNSVNNKTEIVRHSIPETKAVNNLPIITTDLSTSQWILNPFCSSIPLMASTVGTNPSVNTSEMASLLASNFWISNNNNTNQLSGISLDANLTPISANCSVNSNKEIIRFKTCILYPPKSNAPKDTTRERPLGCRTVFVGGLPENITEEILQEVFQQFCGDICAIRLSKKNFCHIRFDSETSVDSAIALSGYRLKINDSEDSANTGRLHIDYAQARDDQYDWECKQRALQREMRHRERLEYDRFCPPSPPNVHFNDHEAIQLVDKLKCDQSFSKAVQVLINWLERGECQKRNSGQFYAMIQSTNNHIKRLQTEKTVFENEWINARQLYHSRIQNILVQFNQIEKVFTAAMKQKAWDHFTKAQRKHIDAWFKQTKELKSVQVEDVVNKREEDEMDLSDGDNEDNATNYMTNSSICDSIDKNFSNGLIESSEMSLRDENDSLKCQIQSFRNEALFVQAESRQEREDLEKQISILQQALQGMQHQLIGLSQQKRANDLEREKWKQTNSVCDNREESCNEKHNHIMNCAKTPLLISLISIYFNVHPYGTTSDDISTYLKQQTHIQDSHLLSSTFIESFLSEFPQLFTQIESDSSGRKLWRFTGFQS